MYWDGLIGKYLLAEVTLANHLPAISNKKEIGLAVEVGVEVEEVRPRHKFLSNRLPCSFLASCKSCTIGEVCFPNCIIFFVYFQVVCECFPMSSCVLNASYSSPQLCCIPHTSSCHQTARSCTLVASHLVRPIGSGPDYTGPLVVRGCVYIPQHFLQPESATQ